MKFKVGMQVKFTSSYEGYFKDLKYEVLTIKSIQVCDDSMRDIRTNTLYIELNEIDEIHLIKSYNLEAA